VKFAEEQQKIVANRSHFIYEPVPKKLGEILKEFEVTDRETKASHRYEAAENMDRLFLKEFRKNNPQNQYLVEEAVYRKQREEEDRVGDQKELLSQYEKKVEERKRLNEIQKAVKQDGGDADQYGHDSHLSADDKILKVLQEV